MEQKKLQKELEALKRNPEKVRAMIALLQELLEEGDDFQQNQGKNVQKNINAILIKNLMEIGITQNIAGYRYLEMAILIVLKDPKMVYSMHKVLYIDIANSFGITPSSVERCIRYAIEKCWNNGNVDCFYKYFGNSISTKKGKPSNSEFIATMANKIKQEIS